MRYATVLACVMVSAAALAGEPAAAQISHQGQNISDHVVLRDGTSVAASRPSALSMRLSKAGACFGCCPMEHRRLNRLRFLQEGNS